MRYELIDRATRDLVVQTAMLLLAGKVSVHRATLEFMRHLRGNTDPQVKNALRPLLAADAEDFPGTPDYEAFYGDDAVASAKLVLSVFDNQKLAGRIASILAHSWDPVGIGSQIVGKGLYDEYVSDIGELLRVEVTERELADHLLRIEDEILRFPVDRGRALGVARLLIESAIELRAQPAMTWADRRPN